MSDTPLLQVRDLTVDYGDTRVVDGVSFEVHAGQCLGIIGESGAGKSQVMMSLLGLCGPAARVGGDARLAGEDLLAGGAQRLRGRRVAMIFQDPLTSLTPHLRIGDQIAEPLIQHQAMPRAKALARAAQLLEQVRVNDIARRLRQYPHELSGGMRQRVMIAMALACDPELLIADEPTTALDVSVQAQLLALLRQLATERRLSLVIVTHDMGVVAVLADHVAVMRQGRIVEHGTVERVLQAPEHEYTRSLIAATPRMDSPFPPAPGDAAAPALQVHDLALYHSLRSAVGSRPAELRAVDGVSLALARGQALGIVGESGCGKSTLVRALLRLLPVTRGEIVWLGDRITHLQGEALRAVRADLQLVFQDPMASLDPTQSVADIVAEPLRALRPEFNATARAARVRQALARVGLGTEYDQRRSHELSGGQCQRVAIARAMILEPKVLVCDEAVSSLDVSIQAQILELLAGIKREQGTGIVFVSHNLAVVRQLCERVLVMYLGRLVEAGPTAAVFSRPCHPYTRMLLASVPLPDPVAERARLAGQRVVGETPSAVVATHASAPAGCPFRTRCPEAQDICAARSPGTEAVNVAHEVACLRWRDIVKSA